LDALGLTSDRDPGTGARPLAASGGTRRPSPGASAPALTARRPRADPAEDLAVSGMSAGLATVMLPSSAGSHSQRVTGMAASPRPSAVISARHARSRPCPSPGPDPRLVAAIVDRVTFNAHILETGTQSYRLRGGQAHPRRRVHRRGRTRRTAQPGVRHRSRRRGSTGRPTAPPRVPRRQRRLHLVPADARHPRRLRSTLAPRTQELTHPPRQRVILLGCSGDG